MAAALLLGQRPPGELDHLQRALQALGVVAADACRGGGIEPGQPRVQRRPPMLRRLLRQPRADRRRRFRQRRQALLQRAEIQAGATDQQWHPALRSDPLHRLPRIGAEVRRRIRLRRIADIDQRVRMARQRGCIRLGGADIHAAIEQCRIHAHQIEPESIGRKALAQRAGQRGLARGGRAHQENGERARVGGHGRIVRRGRVPDGMPRPPRGLAGAQAPAIFRRSICVPPFTTRCRTGGGDGTLHRRGRRASDHMAQPDQLIAASARGSRERAPLAAARGPIRPARKPGP